MELKFFEPFPSCSLSEVLIVPLWNWNKQVKDEYTFERAVLIVPLWNWNAALELSQLAFAESSNRTFMELKYVCIWRTVTLTLF